MTFHKDEMWWDPLGTGVSGIERIAPADGKGFRPDAPAPVSRRSGTNVTF
jgi:hypothetical protein